MDYQDNVRTRADQLKEKENFRTLRKMALKSGIRTLFLFTMEAEIFDSMLEDDNHVALTYAQTIQNIEKILTSTTSEMSGQVIRETVQEFIEDFREEFGSDLLALYREDITAYTETMIQIHSKVEQLREIVLEKIKSGQPIDTLEVDPDVMKLVEKPDDQYLL